MLAAVAWTSYVGIWLLAALCAALAIREARELMGGSIARYLPPLALLSEPLWDDHPLVIVAALSLSWLASVLLALASLRRAGPVNPIVATVVTAGWCVAPLLLLVILHAAVGHAVTWNLANPLLLILLPLWAGDTAAYFVGRTWGKHLLAPFISPKKTVEGAVADLLAAIVVAIPVATWLGHPWPVGLACGVAVGVLGQAGDLFESYLKRREGVKDSGKLLPGHGGLLDRIDSLLFAAPAVALILTFFR